MNNPNERSFDGSGASNKAFYGIDGEGRLFRKATESEKQSNSRDVVEHVKTKGAKAGEIEIRKIVKDLAGYFTAFWVKTSDEFGDSLIVELSDNGFTSVLQMPLESNFADDLIRKVFNIKEGVIYVVQSWKMPSKDKDGKVIEGEFVRGVSVKDITGNKVERYITKEIQEKLLPLASAPLFNAESERQSKDFWKIYFKLLSNTFKEKVIPRHKDRFQKWAEENIASIAQEPKKDAADNDIDWLNGLSEPIVTEEDKAFVKEDIPY